MSDYTRLREAISRAIDRGEEITIAGVNVRPWQIRVINIDQSANVEIYLAVPAEPADERRR